MAIGIIAGTSLLKQALFSGLKPLNVKTRHGCAEVMSGKGFYFIQRHEKGMDILPHEINYRANISALRLLGATAVYGIASSGSLKASLRPGSLVVPDDFVKLTPGPTFFSGPVRPLTSAFTLPGFDAKAREALLTAAKACRVSVKQGTYLEVAGPRLETPAEIRVYARMADIIGMTAASEAILAREAGVPYACICAVDNYGRGIGKKEIDFEDLEQVKKGTIKMLAQIMDRACRIGEGQADGDS